MKTEDLAVNGGPKTIDKGIPLAVLRRQRNKCRC
jgi:hypothetical protein